MRKHPNKCSTSPLFALGFLFVGIVLTVLSLSSCAHDANPYR